MQLNTNKDMHNNAMRDALMGGVCGLAVAIILAIALILVFTGFALGQNSTQMQPAGDSARFECEAGARESVLTGRALGACDLLLRDDRLNDDERARVLTNRAVMFLARGQNTQARRDLEEAVSLAPEMGEAWLNLSAAQISTGSARQAITSAERAGAFGADPALIAFNTAIALETLGDYPAAYSAYAEAARQAPENTILAAQPARFVWHQPSVLND